MSYQLNFDFNLPNEHLTFANNFKHAKTKLMEHIWCRCEGCGWQGYEHNFEFSESAPILPTRFTAQSTWTNLSIRSINSPFAT